MKYIQYYKDSDYFWVRIFGLLVINARHKHRTKAMFRERQGYKYTLTIGSWVLRWDKKVRREE